MHITDYLSKQCCIGIEQVFPGGTYRKDLGINEIVHTRFSRWARSGVWQKIFEELAKDADNEYAMIDSTIVRAHQHSAGAKGGMVQAKPSVAVKVD